MFRRAPRPVRALVDLFVFAPIGFLVEARHLIPELIETGRARLGSRHRLGGVGRGAPGTRPVPGEAHPERATPADPDSRPSPLADAGSEANLPAQSDALPILGYDQLAASQVVARLEDLEPADLAAVERYESAHRRRRTVLAKIAQLSRS